MGVFRLNALRAIDESPWTRHWDHLAPMPKLNRAALKVQKTPVPVPVKDRIRQWNVVPGDRIRIRGDKEGSIREVFGVNKYRNLVYFKAHQREETKPQERPTQPKVPYSKCQLYIGDREFPPLPGETKPVVAPVFATRIVCTAPKYAVNLGRFDWERFAVQTTPRIEEGDDKLKIPIPWPKPPVHPIPAIEPCDTPAEVANKITWRPSYLFYPPSNSSKAKLLQDTYLHSIRPTHLSVPTLEYSQETFPAIEYILGDELSNPHSRTRKQSRFKGRLKARKLAHKRFLEDEIANLDGRTRKEALVEAEWKWTELRRKEEKDRKQKQWVLRGAAARIQRRRHRKERKEHKMMEKMQALVLDPAPNQILPGSQPAVTE